MEKPRKVSKGVKRLVLDVLKTCKSPLISFALHLGSVKGVKDVSIALTEVNRDTESVKVTIKGASIELNLVEKAMNDYGASIQSVDEVEVKNLVADSQ